MAQRQSAAASERKVADKCHACHAKQRLDVAECHACHAKRRWMSPSATPATQSAAASPATKPVQARHPSAISATPATQNEGGCHQVPRLPRDKRRWMHACHAKCQDASPATQNEKRAMCQCVPSATSATENEGECETSAKCHAKLAASPRLPRETKCHQVPRWPRKTKVDVTKCHACHVKRR